MTNRHASIPLTEPTEIVGEWYLPDQPDRVASGRLLYDPEDGLFLETISDVPLLLGPGSAPILLGVAVDGRLVTLRDVDQLSERFSAPGGSSLRASVRAAFVGTHAETPEALRLHSVDARLSHLTHWCSKPGTSGKLKPELSKATQAMQRRISMWWDQRWGFARWRSVHRGGLARLPFVDREYNPVGCMTTHIEPEAAT